jgi:hypothetical protein
MKPYDDRSGEEVSRENSLLSKLMAEVGIQELTEFETELGERQGETLFKITTEIEDTKNALNQVEQLAQRLRKHLERLSKLHQVLSK